MARTEASNTFSDGLIMDLNPINTPNTALTDCLNGTIITYNGNELSLQNDMGNYGLKNCKLDEGYVPVGIKEYNGILYIVSHNPIEKKTQIGSFPSPREVESSIYAGNGGFTVQSIISQITEDTSYTKASELSKLQVFLDPAYKLSAGDRYKIETQTAESKYETFKYYILDTSNKLYDISDSVKVNQKDFVPVTWQNPGYLAVRSELPIIDDLIINTKKMKSTTYGNDKTITGKIEIQVATENTILCDSNDVYLHIVYKDGETDNSEDVCIESNHYFTKPNGQIVLWHSLEIDQTLTTDTLEVLVYPMLKVGEKDEGDDKTNIYITYDHVTKTQSYNLLSKINPDDFTIGENIWQYNVSDNDVKITFDISGITDDGLLNDDLFLFYKLYSLEDLNVTLLDGPKEITEWSIRGNTDVSIKFDNNFKKENAYLIKFEFYKNNNLSEDINPLNITNLYKVIITSELMNGVDAQRMDLVPLERWLGSYTKTLDSFKVIIDKLEAEIAGESKITFSDSYNQWINTDSDNRTSYTTAKGSDLNRIFDKGLVFTNSAPINLKSNASVSGELLTGPLWKKIASSESKAMLTLFGQTSTYSFNDEGKLEAISGDRTSRAFLKFNDTYTFDKSSEFTLIDYDKTVCTFHVASMHVTSKDKDDANMEIKYWRLINNTVAKDTYFNTTNSTITGGNVVGAIINDIKEYGPIVIYTTIYPYTDTAMKESNVAIKVDSSTVIYNNKDDEGHTGYYFLATVVKYNGSDCIRFFKLGGPHEGMSGQTLKDKIDALFSGLYKYTISKDSYIGSFYTATLKSRENEADKEFISRADAKIKLSNNVCLGNSVLGTIETNSALLELSNVYKFAADNLIPTTQQIDFGTYALEPAIYKISASAFASISSNLLTDLEKEYTNGRISKQNEKVTKQLNEWLAAQTVIQSNYKAGESYYKFTDNNSMNHGFIAAVEDKETTTNSKLYMTVFDHDTWLSGGDSAYSSKVLGFCDNEKL